MENRIVKLHQHENGTWGLSYDGVLYGDAEGMTKEQAHRRAISLHNKEDGRWDFDEWVPFRFFYSMPVAPGQSEEMRKWDNT